jgi:hypothetical protein
MQFAVCRSARGRLTYLMDSADQRRFVSPTCPASRRAVLIAVPNRTLMEMPPLPLRVADLAEHFGSLSALDGVSLEVSEARSKCMMSFLTAYLPAPRQPCVRECDDEPAVLHPCLVSSTELTLKLCSQSRSLPPAAPLARRPDSGWCATVGVRGSRAAAADEHFTCLLFCRLPLLDILTSAAATAGRQPCRKPTPAP